MEKCDAGIDEMDDLRKQMVDLIKRVERNPSMSIALKDKFESLSSEVSVNFGEMRHQILTLHSHPDSPNSPSHVSVGHLNLDFQVDDDGKNSVNSVRLRKTSENKSIRLLNIN